MTVAAAGTVMEGGAQQVPPLQRPNRKAELLASLQDLAKVLTPAVQRGIAQVRVVSGFHLQRVGSESVAGVFAKQVKQL